MLAIHVAAPTRVLNSCRSKGRLDCVRVRAVVHEHGNLQACLMARLRNEFIHNRLYEHKQRRRCEAERPSVAVEEWAVR